jgi:hypothetical protein
MGNCGHQIMKFPVGFPIRPSYDVCDFLNARDLQDQQSYFLQQRRNHNRFLHGWGVYCGLRVIPAGKKRRPWSVQVCPGYAIDCCGNEIIVLEPTIVDIKEHLWKAPPKPRPSRAYVGISYDEIEESPVPAKSLGCECEDTTYRMSRTRESFRLDVYWRLPKIEERRRFDICERQLPPCPECTDSTKLVLAAVSLPVSEATPITFEHIDNTFKSITR